MPKTKLWRHTTLLTVMVGYIWLQVLVVELCVCVCVCWRCGFADVANVDAEDLENKQELL